VLFKEIPLKGAYTIDIEPIEDERGWFSRSFCKNEFEKYGLHTEYPQHNISFNARKGTTRGLHYQQEPYGEVKIVRCIQGKIFDVIVDMRENSETYLHWFSVELSENNERMLYIPKNFAHGFQTLTDNAKVSYLMGEYYQKGLESGIRWDDKKLAIPWPICEDIVISEKDLKLMTLEA
jgi:dTDP-4-dehydrorhamnose 3,5-epimerase